jgi:hypothetical protein
MNMIATAPIRNSKQPFDCLRCGHAAVLRIDDDLPVSSKPAASTSGAPVRGVNSREQKGRSDYAARVKKYRDRAEECRQLSDCAPSESERDHYLSLAANYDLMSADMELLSSLNKPRDREPG